MELLIVGVVGVLAVVATTALAPRVRVAAPLLLVLLGIGVSFLPFVAAIEVPPELILGGILPPLLYSSAVSMPTMEFRRDLRTISAFSVVLVVGSALVVGLVISRIVPGVGLATGIALGAILSPTDAVATSIVRSAGVSPRIVTLLEGESLLNDASALVLLRSAVAATAGAVSLWQVAGDFVWAVAAAVAIGYLVGRVNLWVRSGLRQPSSSVAVSLVVPFVAYLPTEELGASGLVAAVTAGLITGRGAARHLRAEDRLTEHAVWRTVELLLESAVFLLMGLELFGLVAELQDAQGRISTAVLLGLLCAVLVMVVRAAYVTASVWSLARRARRSPAARERINGLQERMDTRRLRPPPTFRGVDPEELAQVTEARVGRLRVHLQRRLADLDYLAAEQLGWREGVLVVWAGMRGAVTLAAAQSLPAGTTQRPLLVLIAFVVAAGTLIVQGGSLPFLARRLGLTGASLADPETWAALRAELGAAAARRLSAPDLRRPDGTTYGEPVLGRAHDELERHRGPADDEEPSTAGARASAHQEYRELRLELIEAQRGELVRLRDLGSYPTRMLDTALNQLDADQLGVELRRDE